MNRSKPTTPREAAAAMAEAAHQLTQTFDPIPAPTDSYWIIENLEAALLSIAQTYTMLQSWFGDMENRIRLEEFPPPEYLRSQEYVDAMNAVDASAAATRAAGDTAAATTTAYRGLHSFE